MRVLLLAYHFPPDGEIGSVRPYQLALHLPDHGIGCTVLTVKPRYAESLDPNYVPSDHPGVRIVRTDVERTVRDQVLDIWRARTPPPGSKVAAALESHARRHIRGTPHPGIGRRRGRLLQWALEWLAFPDLRYGWRRPALVAGEHLLASQQFDVILSTSPPRVTHMIAARLSERHRIPWVMDLRDPWFTAVDSPVPSLQAHLHRRMFYPHLAKASVAVTNTDRLRQLIDGVPERTARVVCIPNGFDPDAARADTAQTLLPTRFSLGHFGQVSGRRSERPFLEGLRRWLDANPTAGQGAMVRFVGGASPEAAGLCASLGISDKVVLESRVPRDQVPRLMAEQYVLLLLANEQPLQIPGKAYEYLAAARRVLACTERESATGDLLAQAPGCAVAQGPSEVAAALERFWSEYAAGKPARIPRTALLESMSYRARAADYAALLIAFAAHERSEDRAVR
jgi:hypothetical protein